jgi:hypothetical protein
MDLLDNALFAVYLTMETCTDVKVVEVTYDNLNKQRIYDEKTRILVCQLLSLVFFYLGSFTPGIISMSVIA